MFKKGDYIVIIGSSEKFKSGECSNWDSKNPKLSKMDNYTGKVVKLTRETDSKGGYAKFDGDGGFCWNYYNNHFRLATQEEILAEHLIEGSEQNEVKSIQPLINNEYTIF